MTDDRKPQGPGYTHFGYQQVPVTEKQRRVAGVFTSVAHKYDLIVCGSALSLIWPVCVQASACSTSPAAPAI